MIAALRRKLFPTASERLAATLRPDPEYRRNRERQFTRERLDRIANNLREAGL